MARVQPLPENSTTAFEIGLQELKDLRPQLHVAAEYCEKSYTHSEHKEMVLNNLKDYTVRALVNAVDHLGTVAYKLTDLLEQQSQDITNMDLKVTCLNHQLLTCKTFVEKEGLRQQQLLADIPRHHKHYILPNSANKKVQFSPYIITDPSQLVQVKSRILPSGTPAPKALSWHLASETNSTLKGSALALLRTGDPKVFERTTVKNSTPAKLDVSCSKNATTQIKLPRVGPATRAALQTLGSAKQGQAEELTTCLSFSNLSRQQIIHRPAHRKSMISSFFVKGKTTKVRSSSAS